MLDTLKKKEIIKQPIFKSINQENFPYIILNLNLHVERCYHIPRKFDPDNTKHTHTHMHVCFPHM